MNVTIDDKTINTVISSYQHTEQALMEGSDEHLDLILETKDHLNEMTVLTRELVEEIEKSFNHISADQARDAVIKIYPCFAIAGQIINRLQSSFLYSSLEKSISEFRLELNELKEFVSDLSRYKVQDNSELIALFNEEN